MTRVFGFSVLLAALLASGCRTPAGEPADTTPGGAAAAADQPDQLQGVVRVVGSAPVDVHVVVEPEGESAVRVIGPLRDEISRLSGAVVRVKGTEEPSEMPVTRRQVRATDYEIVSVNGEPVLQGVVEGKMGGWTVLRTRDGQQVYLASAPEDLHTGQKVWVQGPRSMIVQSYGVIRD